jgi:SAM-dependent MidA family methyltransferase
LAFDILGSIQKRRPELFAKLTYILIEPSETRKALQKSTLVDFKERLKWVSQVSDVNGIGEAKGSGCGLRGMFFCNELFDAMPVHVLKWDARRREWIEWGVTHSHNRFTWIELAPWPGPVHSMMGKLAPQMPEVSAGGIEEPHRLYEVLPNGFTTEVCPSATEFWTQACDVIEEGYLLMMDYGLIAEDFFAPQRSEGTLRSYKGHTLNADVLSNPGEQDLTAHVDFSAIADAGERASARTIAYATQAQFLTKICALDSTDGGLKPEGWTPAQRRQFQTLTHPEHLGNAFRVLIQSRSTRNHFTP